MRVAIYARFSNSDRQNARSCIDQIAVCRDHAARRGWVVVAIYQDDGISGFAMANRPGILAAIAAGARGEFDLLLGEDVDRFARNLGHLAAIKDDLEYARARLATLTHDRVELMHIAFNGGGAEQYLVDLGHKTSRGMRANAQRGLATGARLYGYRTQPGGAVEIVPEEAATVLRIFDLFAVKLMSGREIADVLNTERVPGPRGGWWNASTLLGEAKRGNGVLRSEVYAGVKVWNRDEVRKDPRTGQRTHNFRPPAEWQRTPVEHLRIVPAELWEASQARFAATARMTLSARGNQRRPGVFSGLLKCGLCGAGYTSYSKTRLVCAGHRERGPSACSNAKMVDRALVERRVLDGLAQRMLSREAIAAYVRAYHAAWTRIDRENRDRRRPLERRLGELSRSIERIVDAPELLIASPALRDKLAALEAEKATIDHELTAQDRDTAPAVTIHPKAGEAYIETVERLRDALADIGADPVEAAANRPLIDRVRGLVDRIDIIPDEAAPGGVTLRLHGNLSWVLEGSDAGAWRAPTAVNGGSPLVAGGGIGPAPSSVFDVPLHAEAA